MKFTRYITLVICLLLTPAFGANKHVPMTYETEKDIKVSPNTSVKYSEWGVIWELQDGSWQAVHAGKIEKRKDCQKDIASICILYQKKKSSF